MTRKAGQALLAVIPEIREDLPYSPDLLGKLFNQTADGGYTSLAEISKTISRDQGLTVRILSLANSAFYGLQAEVSSVERAVAMLGLKELRTMVLGLGVSSLTIKLKRSELLDLEAYWRHQLLTACCARAVAEGVEVSAEDMFTCGLLHDLGYLITAIYRPDDFRAVKEISFSEGLSTYRAEMRHLGLDHGVIGAMVLSSWDLPQQITEPINWHHSPDKAPAFRKEAELLHASEALSRKFENPSHASDGRWRVFLENYDLDETVLLDMLRELSEDEGTRQLLRALKV
jgi:putative nucleotidyltransferase with HDIG domain